MSRQLHGLEVPEAVELAEALDRRPENLVISAVGVADVGFGIGLSPAVAAAAATLIAAVLTEMTEAFPGLTNEISSP